MLLGHLLLFFLSNFTSQWARRGTIQKCEIWFCLQYYFDCSSVHQTSHGFSITSFLHCIRTLSDIVPTEINDDFNEVGTEDSLTFYDIHKTQQLISFSQDELLFNPLSVMSGGKKPIVSGVYNFENVIHSIENIQSVSENDRWLYSNTKDIASDMR